MLYGLTYAALWGTWMRLYLKTVPPQTVPTHMKITQCDVSYTAAFNVWNVTLCCPHMSGHSLWRNCFLLSVMQQLAAIILTISQYTFSFILTANWLISSNLTKLKLWNQDSFQNWLDSNLLQLAVPTLLGCQQLGSTPSGAQSEQPPGCQLNEAILGTNRDNE